MRHDRDDRPGWRIDDPAGLPVPPDCETMALLRSFIGPILEAARDWDEIADRLAAKGYGIAFREGHLVILAEDGRAICTGSMLGHPLREIAARIGKPCVRASADGQSGALG